MCLELVLEAVVIALDGGFLDGSVHAFDLTIGPWVVDLCGAMFDAMLKAA